MRYSENLMKAGYIEQEADKTQEWHYGMRIRQDPKLNTVHCTKKYRLYGVQGTGKS